MIYIYHQKIDRLWYAAAMEDDKVCATSFGSDEQRVLKGVLESLPYNVSFQLADKRSQFSEKVLNAMKLMVAGESVSVDFKFEMAHLSKYSQRVLGFLAKVPVGYVTTYGDLAEVSDLAPRVVGRVMASNPFAPLIPCHRVVRSDFSIGGYGGGVDMKWAILQREDRGYEEPIKIKVNDSVLLVFPVGFVWKD